MRNPNSQGPFQLHSLKSAKVSEISEATASANIPDIEIKTGSLSSLTGSIDLSVHCSIKRNKNKLISNR